MRRGRIRRRTTGQGASCFKWPWDSVAIIPTTINRLQFTADQVTLEKVGVQVAGLAVYRIVEPEITFRMLNFSFAERAGEKLAGILREMFVGATRRHVANLTVEQAITRRKDAIASELMAELAPVMRGQGQAEDSTQRGWGVVLDTVEIQDVRVLSESVFRDMQAEFRSQLALRARQAELVRAKEIATQEAASARDIDEARITADAATRELRAQAESRATEIELGEEGKREALRAAREESARLAALAREQRIAAAERELLDARHHNALREVELDGELGRARLSRDAELRERESVASEAIRRRELELERLAGEMSAAMQRLQKDIDNTVSDDRIRMALVEQALPAMAAAFAQQFQEARFTQIGQIGDGGADPASMVARGLAQALEIARSMGLRLPGNSNDAAE
jgi:hypothetical protein